MPNIFEELLNKLPIENLFIFRFGKTEKEIECDQTRSHFLHTTQISKDNFNSWSMFFHVMPSHRIASEHNKSKNNNNNN